MHHLRATTAEQAHAIGAAARQRVLRDHTYAARAAELDAALARPMAAAENLSATPSVGRSSSVSVG